MLSKTSTALLLLTLLLPAAALPQEAGPQRWKLSTELNYSGQSGNRNLHLLTGALRVTHLQHESYELEAALETRYARSEEEVIARAHSASLAFDLTPHQAVSPFLFSSVERDPLRRLEVRTQSGAGAKYTFYRGAEAGEASLSLGMLHSYEQLVDAGDPFEREVRHLARWSLRGRASESLRPGLTFHHVSYYQPMVDQMADYLLRSTTGTKILMLDRFSLVVSFQLERNSRPPEGVEPNDLLLRTGFVFDF
jgi:hypothetical protein